MPVQAAGLPLGRSLEQEETSQPSKIHRPLQPCQDDYARAREGRLLAKQNLKRAQQILPAADSEQAEKAPRMLGRVQVAMAQTRKGQTAICSQQVSRATVRKAKVRL